jgi:cytochrome c oxidase cbb3-type subunit III
MSDFTSEFWNWWVILLTVGGFAYCAYLLRATGAMKVKPAKGAQAELTGHTWDGDLAEYNNPLPRWWMWLFWITIAFSAVYLVFFPGLGKIPGVLRWSSASAYVAEAKDIDARAKPLYDKYLAMDVKQVAADGAARAMGERLFLNNCAQCHGSDAGGGRGFPSLRDDDWLYGGEPETIKASITSGRNGIMPPLGAALGEDGVKNVAHYVRSLSGLAHESERAKAGATLFGQFCIACHGADARGGKAVGAPNLTDKVWLYGSSEKSIIETVTKGRGSPVLAEGSSAMPSHKDKLGEGKIHVLAAYVWGLSNKPGAAK